LPGWPPLLTGRLVIISQSAQAVTRKHKAQVKGAWKVLLTDAVKVSLHDGYKSRNVISAYQQLLSGNSRPDG